MLYVTQLLVTLLFPWGTVIVADVVNIVRDGACCIAFFGSFRRTSSRGLPDSHGARPRAPANGLSMTARDALSFRARRSNFAALGLLLEVGP